MIQKETRTAKRRIGLQKNLYTDRKKGPRLAAARLLRLEESTPKLAKGPAGNPTMKVTAIALIGVVVVAALIWLISNGQGEREQFTKLTTAMSGIGQRLEAAEGVQKPYIQTDMCRHWTTDTWKTGWNCSSSVRVEIMAGHDVVAARGELRSALLANEAFVLKERASEAYVFMDKISCEVLISENKSSDRVASMTFTCVGGAKQSWYKNNETHKYPGSEAWRQLSLLNMRLLSFSIG